MQLKIFTIWGFCILLSTSCASNKTTIKEGKTPQFKVVEGRFEKRFDDARSMTLLRVIPPSVRSKEYQFALVVAGGFKGHTPLGYPELLVGVRGSGKSWKLKACNSISLIADGRALGEFKASVDSEIGAGWIAEYLLAGVPFTRAYALARAQKAELVFCGHRYQIAEKERGHLKRLMQELTPQ